jgi:hypothetical protein
MDSTHTSREENVDELVTRIFQPDTLVPYEYFTTSQRSIALEPEKHLMHAILEDAINTFRLHQGAAGGRQRKLFLDAQRWIWARNDEWPFSYENICSALGLDPQFLRSGLARWKEEREANAATKRSSRYPALRRVGH